MAFFDQGHRVRVNKRSPPTLVAPCTGDGARRRWACGTMLSHPAALFPWACFCRARSLLRAPRQQRPSFLQFLSINEPPRAIASLGPFMGLCNTRTRSRPESTTRRAVLKKKPILATTAVARRGCQWCGGRRGKVVARPSPQPWRPYAAVNVGAVSPSPSSLSLAHRAAAPSAPATGLARDEARSLRAWA